MKKKEATLLVINTVLPAAAGFLAYLLTKNNMNIYSEIFVPSFAPPAALFPFVWSILYILSGYSFYLAETSGKNKAAFAKKLYFANIFFNFFWPIIFFNFRDFAFAFVWIVVLWLITFWLVCELWRINKKSALLNLPYLLWLSFAAVLSFAVAALN